ncbi:TetR/AcrR family transcriptional regulator [Leifsonia aquatica]|jgi:AcrR family transcriptional regulator|uniref:Transcriptional regulator, TetR family n=2 Tax=Leifsonia aquatica TaxID=144185 RepID=U2TC72_LEIAQ|nr:TetR/AcrR family transcriptional regulator [Leifsonia aquatica]ERK72307.1 transcriptional regulator, TetR family [Leifsonia aquatica ATCC 14665]MBB2966888.1 AcrR family transcriptional regulator [Leifsonia aquatica]
MVVSARATIRPPAPSKIKILATADELFYQEGIHTVGVDRIIAGARVTKATFYKHFRSKDLLIIAYVEGRDRQVREWFTVREQAGDDPREIARALVDSINEEAIRPGFRGDPFINAAAQFADENHPVRVAVTAHRDWYAKRIEQLFRELGHPRPGDAADDLILARDGALAGGYVGDPIAAGAALHRSLDRILSEK